jgi:hypothetical protein
VRKWKRSKILTLTFRVRTPVRAFGCAVQLDLTGQVFFSQCCEDFNHRAGLQALGVKAPKAYIKYYLEGGWSQVHDMYVDYIGVLRKVKK